MKKFLAIFLFFFISFFLIFSHYSYAGSKICTPEEEKNQDSCDWTTNYTKGDDDCCQGYSCRRIDAGFGGVIGKCYSIGVKACTDDVKENPDPCDIKSDNCCQGYTCFEYGGTYETGISNTPGTPKCIVNETYNGYFQTGETAEQASKVINNYPPPGCTQTGPGSNISVTCNTGLGIEITADPQNFAQRLFGITLSISGGIALILIIISGYQLMVSGGNPDKVKGARERLTSAIVGLVFIIFSIVILQLIGVDILRIPGFT